MVIRKKSDYERKGKDISSYPSMYKNSDFGKKRKANTHNVVMKNSATGQVFGYKTIEEAEEDTRLPANVVRELTTLIRKGANDVEQAWKNAYELVNTAYAVANVQRPFPAEKGAWKQYEELLAVGVKALANSRGLTGDWRMTKAAFYENWNNLVESSISHEAKRQRRIFVRVKEAGYDDSEQEYEVAADSINDVVQSIMAQMKRRGLSVEIVPKSDRGIDLVVYAKGVNKHRVDQYIKIKDISF